jgi:hypothetical protein
MEATRLSHDIWREVLREIERAKPRSEVTYGRVIKRDVKNRLIWLAEFGDTPIPIVAFTQKIRYYDSETTGATPTSGAALPNTVKIREAIVEIEVPQIGQVAVILRQLGVRRLPKCLGIIQSTGFVELT